MLKEDELIGAFTLSRQEVRPFTDKQIESGQELRRPSRYRHRERAAAQRTASAHRLTLTEALEQQTATSEVLEGHQHSSQLIYSPSLHLMLENAVRLCDASFGNHLAAGMESYRGLSRATTLHRLLPSFGSVSPLVRRGTMRPRARSKPDIHVTDCAEDPAYKQRHPGAVAMVELEMRAHFWAFQC